MSNPTPNDDEQIQTQIGNFHKSLPHGPNGVVDANEYQKFRTACVALEAGLPVDFEHIRAGKPQPDHEPAMFTNPLAGAATEQHGPDPKDLEMPPAPGILSASSAAELIELYWMALLRDVPLADLNNYPDAGTAVSELTDAFHNALNADRSAGGLKLHGDLPHDPTGLDLRVETLFGCGLLGEDKGPRISQFFLQDIPYGVQRISPKQRPYASGENFLTTYASWFYAQDTGLDYFGRDYAQCNHYADELTGKVKYYATQARCISTLRDLARFVNRDALHQAYFNAALFLDAIGAPLDGGNPYVGAAAAKKRRECSCIDGGDDAQDMRDCPCLQDVCGARYKREGGFATLGGPDLLTLVSEVASRALKVVWRQKWLVHRRSRPEALAGYLHIQTIGTDTGATTPFGISEDISKSLAGQKIYAANKGGYFLPMAFSAGSPNHPAYGAGHATVAGACVTILKAWFDEEACLSALLPTESCSGASGRPEAPKPAKEPFDFLSLREPGPCKGADEFEDPQAYCGADRHKLTVGGELNKLASNVAMGRSIGGVHWRSDNTRSLRLGEQIAIEILRKRTHEYAEAGASFSFTSFDGHKVTI